MMRHRLEYAEQLRVSFAGTLEERVDGLAKCETYSEALRETAGRCSQWRWDMQSLAEGMKRIPTLTMAQYEAVMAIVSANRPHLVDEEEWDSIRRPESLANAAAVGDVG